MKVKIYLAAYASEELVQSLQSKTITRGTTIQHLTNVKAEFSRTNSSAPWYWETPVKTFLSADNANLSGELLNVILEFKIELEELKGTNRLEEMHLECVIVNYCSDLKDLIGFNFEDDLISVMANYKISLDIDQIST